MQVIKEVQDSPSQSSCHILDFGQSSFVLNFNETLKISTNMTLYGVGAVITCNYSFNMFNHSAIIMVNNVHYFGISGITFIGCPSSLHFENVTHLSINDSYFRYVQCTNS